MKYSRYNRLYGAEYLTILNMLFMAEIGSLYIKSTNMNLEEPDNFQFNAALN